MNLSILGKINKIKIKKKKTEKKKPFLDFFIFGILANMYLKSIFHSQNTASPAHQSAYSCGFKSNFYDVIASVTLHLNQCP